MFYEHERENAIDFMTEGKGKVKYIEMEAKLIACKIFQVRFCIHVPSTITDSNSPKLCVN